MNGGEYLMPLLSERIIRKNLRGETMVHRHFSGKPLSPKPSESPRIGGRGGKKKKKWGTTQLLLGGEKKVRERKG